MRLLAVASLAACSAHAPASTPSQPRATCRATVAVHVVDETGAPLPGATVHTVADFMQCGPSGLAEGCGGGTEESPAVVTDASGAATVCNVAADLEKSARAARPEVIHGSAGTVIVPPPQLRRTSASIVVDHGDWPSARVSLADAPRIAMGPARTAIVEVPAACPGASHVRVRAFSSDAAVQIWAKPIPGGMRARQFRLDGLGPWRYWVQSTDAACPSFVRMLDGRAVPEALVLDHSDGVAELAAFAGGRATVSRAGEVIATETLDAEGRATLALPATSGSVYCLRVEKDDRCLVTFARAGEIARPGLYAGRELEIEAACGRCRMPTPTP